jgi:hypothetical protein
VRAKEVARSAIITVNASAPKIATSLSIDVSPTSGDVPITINVISTLYDSAGNPLLGKPIIEYINDIWIGERYSGTPFSMYIKEAGIYRFQTKFAGDDDYLACDSPVVTVTLTAPPPPKIPTSITIDVSPTSGRVPFTVTVSGNLSDNVGSPVVGRRIDLYVDGAYIKSEYTNTSGNYVISTDITTAGTYQFQTEFPGDETYEGCAVHNGTHGLEGAPPPDWGKVLLVGGLLAFVYFAVKK